MKIYLAGAIFLGAAVGAQAADMISAPYAAPPAYIPPAVVAPVYDWTGFYIGVNAGVGLGRDLTNLAIPVGTPTLANDTTYLSPVGGLGGGQIGYNVQVDSFLGPLLYGIEADIQGGDLRDSRTTGPGLTANYNQSLNWFGTVRGRVALVRGAVISYLTGGYAYGDVRTSVTEPVGLGTGTFTASGMRSGWTYGSGVEAALGGNWTGKIEYLYVSLGNRTDLITINGPAQGLNTRVSENIFRGGLNYRIGGSGLYSTVPAANWTGFYLGGNFGGGTARDRTAITSLAYTDSFSASPDGYIGGGQAGYNWQAANLVFGVEADIQGSSLRDNKTCIASCTPAVFATYDSRLPWFATARGRLGYSVGTTLFYVTGGYAYGSIRTDINSPAGSYSLRTSRGGWTAGAGIEAPFTLFGLLGPNWTSKTEYLYVDLGSTTTSGIVLGVGPATNTTRVQEHIARSGINYHFN